MFKRFITSISKPPLTVYFMKDSWWRIVGYILLVPILLVLPSILSNMINPKMSNDRFDALIEVIQEDFRVDQAIITDGILSVSNEKKADFDYFQLVIGTNQYDDTSLNIAFLEEDVVIILSNMEFQRFSYESLGLLNHDFSSTDLNDIKVLAIAIKSIIETSSIAQTMDSSLIYFLGLYDYIFNIVILSLFSMVFFQIGPMPFSYRFKLSVYLSTITVLVAFILQLFNLSSLSLLGFFVGYIYHVWAYRKMRIIPKGGM